MADLITVQEYKTVKGIAKNDQDDKLNLLVKAASNLIQAYVGYSFDPEAEVTETITPGYYTDVVHLRGYPIHEILDVEEVDPIVIGTGLDSTVTWPLLVNSGYRYNPYTGGLFRMDGYWGTVNVTYRTGYAEIPEDIKLAAIALVEYYLKEQYTQSKSILGTNITHTVTKEVPPQVKIILDSYKL